ncbi:coiled-coil domain-containing protein 82-like [Mixophyes fleayi]|uniref:coiled-coil domain-containing protein 82-like n=1 Tax=Mixophyes fleayi TaxID=3061075 RepID=UPI003F4DC821
MLPDDQRRHLCIADGILHQALFANMESTSKNYDTRRKRKSSESVPKSRVDWKRTKVDSINHILDSDELSTSEEGTEGDDGDSSSTGESERKQSDILTPSADNGDDHINKPRQRRKSTMITSSDSSSDGDWTVRRVCSKRRCIDEDDETHEGKDRNLKEIRETSEDEEAEAHLKKQKRLERLNQLAERRRSRCRTSSRESFELSSSDMNAPLTLEVPSESEDSDSMSDFIEPDDEENQNEEVGDVLAKHRDLFRKHNISQFACSDLHSHLQKVIKAFLINIADNTFLTTLYERTREKRYAKDLLRSLNYLQERILAPRLEKLTTSCRWTSSYKERVSCYPDLGIKGIGSEHQHCDACKLQRHCSFQVTLSGQAYDKETLENDDFLPNDKQVLFVGNVCASRTKVYHQTQHYKYHLYQRCIPFLEEIEEVPAKELVDRALSKMEEEEFINKEVDLLEGYLNDADYFQEEMLDSLIV